MLAETYRFSYHYYVRELRAAISVLEAEDDDFVDPRELSSLIDRLQGKLCRVVAAARKRGEHLLAGQSPCSWVAMQCQMSRTSAADRLCVGEELAHLPRIAQALSSGEIGFQAASVICHLSEQIGEKRAYIEEEDWIGFARRFSACTGSTAGSTRRAGRRSRARSNPSPDLWVRATGGLPSSAGRIPWSSSCITPWTGARCLGATGFARTSASTPRSKA